MSQTVPALGVALVTVAGCVWYLPALADLRARADRPPSRRTAAAACLSGWAAVAAVAVLLLLGVAWQAAGATAGAGATAAAALRIRAAAQHRQEVREMARHWAALHPSPPQHGRRDERSRYVFVALVASGLIAAVATAGLALAAGPEGGRARLIAVVAPAAVVGVFLILGVTYAHAARGGAQSAAGRTRR